jgi:tripartite-type tricarboxylate transporter receptor subunit TctC
MPFVTSRALPLTRPAVRRRPGLALHHLRRRRIVGGALLAAMRPGVAAAQPQARRALRVLLGFPAGSTPDTLMRLIAGALGERLGQPVVVENRPGAVGAIAGEAAARSAPDGTTLLMMPHGFLVLPALQPGLPFDPVQDFVFVAGVASAPLVLLANPALGLRSAADFVAHARGREVAYGMSGVGASPHLAMEVFARRAGFSATAVPFRGDPEILPAILSGQVAGAFALAPTAVPLAREGRLTPLAVTAPARLAALPGVPTMAEQGWPDATLASWWGLVGPKGIAPAEAARLGAAARGALSAAAVADRLGETGVVPLDLGPEEFGAFALRERARLLALYEELGLLR